MIGVRDPQGGTSDERGLGLELQVYNGVVNGNLFRPNTQSHRRIIGVCNRELTSSKEDSFVKL